VAPGAGFPSDRIGRRYKVADHVSLFLLPTRVCPDIRRSIILATLVIGPNVGQQRRLTPQRADKRVIVSVPTVTRGKEIIGRKQANV